MLIFQLHKYDDGKNLYIRELLTDFTQPIRIQLKANDKNNLFGFKVWNLIRPEQI